VPARWMIFDRLAEVELVGHVVAQKPTTPSRIVQDSGALTLGGTCQCADREPDDIVHLFILRAYAHYYNAMRTHRSLDKDAPRSRPVQRTGSIVSYALLGGLHHHYVRV
jgi:hypothetical protein